MPTTRLSEDALLDRLGGVFRTHGFEGASLSIISEATGLRRSSLYHRFPGGKEEMALRVLEWAEGVLVEQALAPLSGGGPIEARAKAMCKGLLAFYESGEAACVLDTLTVSRETDERIHEAAREAADRWIGAMARVAKEAGASARESRQRAEAALAAIEGALVVARVLGDPRVFRRVVAGLPALLGVGDAD